MAVLNACPLAFRLHYPRFHLIVGRCLLSLYEHTCIKLIFQHPCDGDGIPLRCLTHVKRRFQADANAVLIRKGWENSLFIQRVRDCLLAHSEQLHPENVLHDACRIFINHNPVLILLRLPVAV